jgi:pilus assembly protein FimV
MESPTALLQEPPAAVTYEVKRGDTLSKIAVQNKVDGVSLQQMLIAMFRANREAFVGDNMNRLRAGKIINVPEQEEAASVSPADARRIVVAQFADFKDYRSSLAGAVAAASPPQESGRQASGSITAQKEQPTPPKGGAKDQLRLSGADDAKRGGTAAGTAAADDLAAKDKALREANERIALLEKNLQDLQKLAQIKSESGAQLQQQAQAAKAGQAGQPPKPAQLEGPTKAAPAPKVEAPKGPEPAKAAEAAKAAAPATKAPEAAKAGEPAKAPLAAKSPEPAKAPEAGKAPAAPAPQVAKAPEPAKAAEAAKAPEAVAKATVPGKAEAAKAAPTAAPKAAPQPVAEPSFFDELLDNPYALGGAGGAVILLAGYAIYAWRKKRTAQFASGVMSVVPSDVNSVLGTAGGRNVDTGSSSFQSDFSQAGIGKIDTEEIDPIAEADVYMAYGRDTQAEEILREALAKDSSRQAIRLKLLEIYANRKDARAFEAAANELHAATGGRGPDWEKAANLGLSIDSTNPLYGGKPSVGMATTRMPAVAVPDTDTTQQGGPVNIDFDIGGATSTTPPPDINLDAGTPSQAGAAPAGLDFDLGLGGDKLAQESPVAAIPEAPAAPAADTGLMSIDFNLPASEPAAQAAPEPAVSAGPATDLGAIDFDIGLPGSSEAKAEVKSEAAPKTPAIELGAISLDLGTPGGGNGSGGAPDARWQEVATKLDLAKAYEEMGDKDGARELLKEVVKEGDTAQQQQAQTMLQSLG